MTVFEKETLKSNFAAITSVAVSSYIIPTDFPESDGTLAWESTTLHVVKMNAGNKSGIGYTYGNISIATYIQSLQKFITGKNVFDNISITDILIQTIRNDGSCGIAMMAVSAVDNALWDLKAKLLDLPLCTLLGKVKDKIRLYGSGGFTSYSDQQMEQCLSEWIASGIRAVKIKIGRNPNDDVRRVAHARTVIGNDAELFVDANGGYSVSQSLEMGAYFSDQKVSWFEEPVTSDNISGLQFIRRHIHSGIHVAAGEYGYKLSDFLVMLEMHAVDILQADATRCGGITGFLKAGQLAEAYHIPFSSHCATTLHVHPALSLPGFYIAEHFHDHERIESLLFDTSFHFSGGYLSPDMSRAGAGYEFKYADAERFKTEIR